MNIEKTKEQYFLDIEDPFGLRSIFGGNSLGTAEHPACDPLHGRVDTRTEGPGSAVGDREAAGCDQLHGRDDTRTEEGGRPQSGHSLNDPLHPIVEEDPVAEVKKERINIENECKKMKNIKTLVLEGCGTSGFYILGYIQKAIDIYKLDLSYIKNYIASSSGAITSFLLSIGYTPMEILIYVVKDSGINSSFEKIKKINIANMLLGKWIISFEIIKKIITDMTLEKIGYIPTFSDIKKTKNINLVFSVYNITKQITEYMSYTKYPELSCIDCIEMSCAIPVIFPEIVYNRQRYIDGGVGNCFPVEMLSILKEQETASEKPAAERSTSETDELSDYTGAEPNCGADALRVDRGSARGEAVDCGAAALRVDHFVARCSAVDCEAAALQVDGPKDARPLHGVDRGSTRSSDRDRGPLCGPLLRSGRSEGRPPVTRSGLKSSHPLGGENDGEFKKNTLAISLTNRHIIEEIWDIYENPLKYLLSLFLIYVNEIKKNKKINKDNNIIFVDLDVSNSSITNTVLESNIQILDMFSYGYKQCRK